MGTQLIIVIMIGISVGLIMGLTGAGGSMLSVPLLMFFLHIKMVDAISITLISIAVSSSIGAFFYLRLKILRYKAAILIGLTGALFSPLGVLVSHHIPNTPLMLIFSAVLIFTSLRTLFKPTHVQNQEISKDNPYFPCRLNQSTNKLIWTLPCIKTLVLSGSFAGFFSGLLGIGGGLIVTPTLNKFTNLSTPATLATSLGILAIISTGGALFSMATQTIQWNIALPFVISATIGIMISKLFITKIRKVRAQQIFALFSFCVGLSLIYKIIF
jgi:uncharacterized membrane protein YfcA